MVTTQLSREEEEGGRIGTMDKEEREGHRAQSLQAWRKDSEAALAATTSAPLSPRKGTESVGQNTSREAFQQWPSGDDG